MKPPVFENVAASVIDIGISHSLATVKLQLGAFEWHIGLAY
jgi:hypothetical protein